MATPIERDGVQLLVAEGALLVEVLSPVEYAEEHLPGAVNIPLKELNAARVRDLDRNRPVVLYCHDYQ